ncbi:FAD-dependent oxidoreductase, partial [Novosphingobium sp.]|uniref:GcvT family protein n=1 Tax=Novosphingobium sp. TaxID=1874826 RepID=UPI00286A4F79
CSPEQVLELKRLTTMAKSFGLPMEVVSPERAQALFPLMSTQDVLAAAFLPTDGYIDPASVTQAIARGARMRGAQIHEHTKVTSITVDGRQCTTVHTSRGDIECEMLVNAAGMWGMEVGRMAGVRIPATAVEHQYLLSGPIEGYTPVELGKMPTMRDPDHLVYYKPDGPGLLIGGYEPDTIAFGTGSGNDGGIPSPFQRQLFEPNFDRFAQLAELGTKRTPCLEQAGIRMLLNGPIPYSADADFVMGRVPELDNYFVATGFLYGIAAGGGAGKMMAEWMLEGRPSLDLWPLDVRRFSFHHTTRHFMDRRMVEMYAHHYKLAAPGSEKVTARGVRRSPLHSTLAAHGAVFGSRGGWERPNWFAPKGYELSDADLDRPDVLLNHNHPDVPGAPIREKWSFRRSNYFEHVGAECRHVTEKVGLQDMSAFAKCRISGPGAEEWLGGLLTNAVPKKIGRVTLSYLLTKNGGVRAEFTVYKTGPQDYYLVSAGAYERHDQDYLKKALPTDGSVTFERLTTAMGVLVLAGPRSRDVLAKLTRADLSNEAFPWLTGQKVSIGAAPVDALRVNFIGELGWEIHHPIEMQNYIFDAIMAAGAEFDIKPFGIRAMTLMAMEKSYKLIPRELSIEYNAYESGLDRFISLKKPGFHGKDALLAGKDAGLANQLVTMEVLGVTDADARGSEAVYLGDELVGRATSGGYGWRVGKSLALAMVRPDLAAVGTELEIAILGQRYTAVVIADSPFDPENTALRG